MFQPNSVHVCSGFPSTAGAFCQKLVGEAEADETPRSAYTCCIDEDGKHQT